MVASPGGKLWKHKGELPLQSNGTTEGTSKPCASMPQPQPCGHWPSLGEDDPTRPRRRHAPLGSKEPSVPCCRFAFLMVDAAARGRGVAVCAKRRPSAELTTQPRLTARRAAALAPVDERDTLFDRLVMRRIATPIGQG